MMKTYLWIMHLAFGGIGLFASLTIGDEFEKIAFSFILFSVVALLCLVYLYASESKSKPEK
jgi:predicted membrane channel-forming protein YqfA (hemolysin III family)